MRLTVHHSAELLPYWLDSLNKLLATDGLNRDKLLNAGHWHVATFNDRIVGLAVTKDEELIYFAVRDATRRRGVGQYLLTETLNWMRSQGCSQAMLSTHAARPDVAVDGGDHRDGQLEDRSQQPCGLLGAGGGKVAGVASGGFTQVSAGAEGAAGVAEHHDPHAGVVCGIGEALPQLVHQLT